MRITAHTERGTFVSKAITDEGEIDERAEELNECIFHGRDYTMPIEGGTIWIPGDVVKTSVFVVED